MEELIKKFVYTGVGVVAFTAEKVKEIVDNLVTEEKLTEEEGKKIVNDFLSNTEEKKGVFEEQLKAFGDKVNSMLNLGKTDTDELEDLKARIEVLEGQLATKNTPASKPASGGAAGKTTK